MVKWSDTRHIHGVPLIVPGVDGVGASRNGVDLDGFPDDLLEVHGVIVHRFEHLLLDADATPWGIFVGRPGT